MGVRKANLARHPLQGETLRRRRRNDRIAMAVWILLLGGFGAWQLADALIWDSRVRNWRQVPGVILKTDRVKVRSGRSTKTVSRIEYEYRFEGRRYTGSRILYGGDFFPPAIKPGAPRKILVDPAAPAGSAAMLYYRGHWGLLRYGGPAANFAGIGAVSKVVLIMDMLAGRLEIFPIIVLFSRKSWQRG